MPRKTSKSTETPESKPRAPRAKKTKKNGAVESAAAVVSAAPATPTPDQIRARAYEIFRSGSNRDPAADWFQAEQELRAKATA